MKINDDKKTSLLRHKAEAKLKQQLAKKKSPPTEADNIKLRHELQVHQIELDMQHEELMVAELSAARYADLFLFAPSGYLTLSREGDIIQLNISVANMLGKDRSSLINNRFGFFISNHTKPIYNQFLEKLFESKGRGSCEVMLTVEGRSPQYIIIKGIATENAKQCLLTIIDITERKQIEDALKVSEEKYRLLFENMTSGFQLNEIIVDENNVPTNFRFLDGNSQSKQLTGIDIEELKGKTCKEVFPDVNCNMIKKYGEVANTGEPNNFNYFVEKFQKHFEIKVYSPQKGQFACLYDDITERIVAEKEKEQYFKFFQTSKDIMCMANPNGSFIKTNPACTELLGYAEEELISKPFVDFVVPEDKQSTLDEMAKQIQMGSTLNFENRYRCKDGSVKWLAWRAIFVKEEGVTYAIARDITESKKVELIITEQNLELQKLNANKDRFLSILSHDLRSPFSSVVGLLNLLSKNIYSYDIAEINKLVTIITTSSQNTYNLIEDLLIWSTMQSGKTPFYPQEINFLTICAEVVEILRPSATIKNITLNYFTSEDIIVFADLDMIKTILRNLISNAIKFTNKGGNINIYAEQNHTITKITVSDNGVGISPEFAERLFDISQIHTVPGTANERGTGLGLLLCKEFVEKHGGKIWAETTLGEGSEFIFTLPKQNANCEYKITESI